MRNINNNPGNSRMDSLKLQLSKQEYKHLFQKSPIAIFVTDKNGKILDINETGIKLIGYASFEDIIEKKSIFDLIVKSADRRRYAEISTSKKYLRDFETQIRKRDNKILDVKISLVALEYTNGVTHGYEGIILDVTDQKRIEIELRTAEEKYRTVLESSLSAIYMFQDGGKLSYVNPRLLEIVGYGSADELLGCSFWNFVHPEDREFVKKTGLAREKAETFPRHYSLRLIKKDKSLIWVDLFGTHGSYQGKPAVIGNFIDITKIRQAEKEVRQLSRRLIEVIEEERKHLAADLHDEFGQALTTLQFDLKLIEQSLPPEFIEQRKRCRKMIGRIQQLGDSVRTTTSRLRPELLDHLGLTPTIRSQVNELNELKTGIKIDFQTTDLKKRLNPNIELTIYRIFQEALNNATKHAKANLIRIQLKETDSTIKLRIEDNGIGFNIEEVNLPKKTKVSGIGLLSMKERVAVLGGKIKIQSSKTKGTLINVELPIE